MIRSRRRSAPVAEPRIPPPPPFKPPPLPEEDDGIFIRPITRVRSPQPPPLPIPGTGNLTPVLEVDTPESSRSVSPNSLSSMSRYSSSPRPLSPGGPFYVGHDTFIRGGSSPNPTSLSKPNLKPLNIPSQQEEAFNNPPDDGAMRLDAGLPRMTVEPVETVERVDRIDAGIPRMTVEPPSSDVPRMEIEPPTPTLERIKPEEMKPKQGRKVAYQEVKSPQDSEEPLAKSSKLASSGEKPLDLTELPEMLGSSATDLPDPNRFPAQEENFTPSKFKRRQSKKIHTKKKEAPETTDSLVSPMDTQVPEKDSLAVDGPLNDQMPEKDSLAVVDPLNAPDLTEKERHVISEVLNSRRSRSRSNSRISPSPMDQQNGPVDKVKEANTKDQPNPMVPAQTSKAKKSADKIVTTSKDTFTKKQQEENASTAERSFKNPLTKQAKDKINIEAKKCLDKSSLTTREPEEASARSLETTNKVEVQQLSPDRRTSEIIETERRNKLKTPEHTLLDNSKAQTNSDLKANDPTPVKSDISQSSTASQDAISGIESKARSTDNLECERETRTPDTPSVDERVEPLIPADLLIPDFVENIADLTVEQLKEHVQSVVQSLSEENVPCVLSMEVEKVPSDAGVPVIEENVQRMEVENLPTSYIQVPSNDTNAPSALDIQSMASINMEVNYSRDNNVTSDVPTVIGMQVVPLNELVSSNNPKLQSMDDNKTQAMDIQSVPSIEIDVVKSNDKNNTVSCLENPPTMEITNEPKNIEPKEFSGSKTPTNDENRSSKNTSMRLKEALTGDEPTQTIPARKRNAKKSGDKIVTASKDTFTMKRQEDTASNAERIIKNPKIEGAKTVESGVKSGESTQQNLQHHQQQQDKNSQQQKSDKQHKSKQQQQHKQENKYEVEQPKQLKEQQLHKNPQQLHKPQQQKPKYQQHQQPRQQQQPDVTGARRANIDSGVHLGDDGESTKEDVRLRLKQTGKSIELLEICSNLSVSSSPDSINGQNLEKFNLIIRVGELKSPIHHQNVLQIQSGDEKEQLDNVYKAVEKSMEGQRREGGCGVLFVGEAGEPAALAAYFISRRENIALKKGVEEIKKTCPSLEISQSLLHRLSETENPGSKVNWKLWVLLLLFTSLLFYSYQVFLNRLETEHKAEPAADRYSYFNIYRWP